jgi:4-hydroxy-tetrahydrodipicolinate reductase
MGSTVCAAVAEDPELSLVAAVDRTAVGARVMASSEVRITDRLGAIEESGAEVGVDFTQPDSVLDNVRWLIEHHVHAVVGTTGMGPDDLAEIERLLEKEGGRSNVFVAPNFAIGAVLAERFAAEAARFFPAAEVIELHHDQKADSPSGTALSAARRLVRERADDYRGPDRESLEGSTGQVLTIRHDSMDRSSFMPGVLMAIKSVGDRPGLTVGLEALL